MNRATTQSVGGGWAEWASLDNLLNGGRCVCATIGVGELAVARTCGWVGSYVGEVRVLGAWVGWQVWKEDEQEGLWKG